MFEKKYNLHIANFTSRDGTLVHKAYPSNYHSPNANFNNYHTVQYLPEGTLKKNQAKLQNMDQQTHVQPP